MSTLVGNPKDHIPLTAEEETIIQAITVVDRAKLAAYLISNVRNIMRSNKCEPDIALNILLERGVLPNARVLH